MSGKSEHDAALELLAAVLLCENKTTSPTAAKNSSGRDTLATRQEVLQAYSECLSVAKGGPPAKS